MLIIAIRNFYLVVNGREATLGPTSRILRVLFASMLELGLSRDKNQNICIFTFQTWGRSLVMARKLGNECIS